MMIVVPRLCKLKCICFMAYMRCCCRCYLCGAAAAGLVWSGWLVSLVGVFIAKNPRNMFLNLSKADDDGHKKKLSRRTWRGTDGWIGCVCFNSWPTLDEVAVFVVMMIIILCNMESEDVDNIYPKKIWLKWNQANKL